MRFIYINSEEEDFSSGEEQDAIQTIDNSIDLDKMTLIKITLENSEIYTPVEGVLKEMIEVIKNEQKSKAAMFRKKFET